MSSVQVCYLTNIQGTCNNLICTYPVTRKWNKARQLRSCAALLPRWRNAIAGQDVSGGFARLLYAFGRRRRAFLLAAALFDQWAHPTRVRCPPHSPCSGNLAVNDCVAISPWSLNTRRPCGRCKSVASEGLRRPTGTGVVPLLSFWAEARALRQVQNGGANLTQAGCQGRPRPRHGSEA